MRTLSLPDQTGNAGKILFTDGENIYWDTGGGLGDQTAIQFQDEGVNLGGSGSVDTLDFAGTGVSAVRVGNTVTVTISAATPAGADTQIQFNDAGAFGASANFTYNKITGLFEAGITGARGISIDPTTRTYSMGDIDVVGNGASLFISDPTEYAALTAGTYSLQLDGGSDAGYFGFVGGGGKATFLGIDTTGATGKFNFNFGQGLGAIAGVVFEKTFTALNPVVTTAGGTNELRFLELAANGTNYTGFKSTDARTTDLIYLLPSTDPVGGQVLTAGLPLAGTSVLSWTTPTTGTVTSVGLTVGTAGTDISVSGSPVTGAGSFTLDIPTASATNRGALSSADWITFNSKLSSVSLTAGEVGYGSAGNVLTSDSTFTYSAANARLTLSGAGAGTTGTLLINRGDSVNQYIVLAEAGASPNSAFLTFKSTGGNAIAMGARFLAGAPLSYVFTDPSGTDLVTITTATGAMKLGVAGTIGGTLQLSGTTSGVVSIVPQTTAGTWSLTLPAVAGTANQMFGMSSGGVNSEWKTFATGTAGTDFAIAHTANTVTFNIPDAGASARGLVTTGTQVLAGAKTFSSGVTIGAAGTGALQVGTVSLVYRTTNGGSNVTAQSGFDVDNSNSTAGSQMWAFDSTNGFIGTVANGTRRIARVALKTEENINTAGSETSALGFYIKPPSGAMELSHVEHMDTVSTTNNTQTTLHVFTVPASTTYMIEAWVTARRTGGVAGTAEDGAGYKIIGTYKNVAGTATLIGAVSAAYTAEDQAGWDATFDVTGATVRCRVTGAVNNNINWKISAIAVKVS